jgi:ribose 5-phosphate isomerase A
MGKSRIVSDTPKEAAGRRAAEEIRDGMKLGLGTGSTVHFVLVRLAERIAGEGLRVRGVPTSRETADKAREMGIPLAELNDLVRLDLYLDGADEVDPEFRLIKGAGGALLREKIVAAASRDRVIVVDRTKLVDRLGSRAAVPVEVVPFARKTIEKAVADLGGPPRLRTGPDGEPYRTDEGNEILDCRFASGIADPAGLERALAAIPGVVESGLFIGLADRLIIGGPDGRVEIRKRRPASDCRAGT